MTAVRPIYVVLGKRLSANQLTLEGKSRVDGLICELQRHSIHSALVVFCGGITQGQSVSEAQRMFEYFKQQCQAASLTFPNLEILLEQQSTSTVENIEHVVQVLRSSGQIRSDDTLTLTLVSNDYHLKRIVEIQHLMEEQGLLRTLELRGLQAGVKLNISRELDAHICVPYPHHHAQGTRFLWVDELTTYRVFLEGVVAKTFQRPIAQVHSQPYRIAQKAIAELRAGITQEPMLLALLALIETVVEVSTAQLIDAKTEDSTALRSVAGEALAILDTELTLLNRLCDPELERSARWWKR